MAAFLVLSFGAIAVLLYPYVHYSRLYGFARSTAEVASMLPRWQSYLLADGSLLWRGLSAQVGDVPVRHEHQMFLGAGVVVLALSGIGYRRDRWAIASLVALGLLVLVTTKFPHFSIYSKLLKVPGLSAVRAVARIVLVMLFPVAILVARAVERSLLPESRRGLIALVTLGVLVMLVECAVVVSYKTPIKDWRARLALYQDKLPDSLPSDAILFVPLVNQDDTLPEIDGVILAQDRGLVTLNGYSGNSPPSYPYDFIHPCQTATLRVSSYANFAKLSDRERQALLDRVIPVGMPDCHPGRVY